MTTREIIRLLRTSGSSPILVEALVGLLPLLSETQSDELGQRVTRLKEELATAEAEGKMAIRQAIEEEIKRQVKAKIEEKERGATSES